MNVTGLILGSNPANAIDYDVNFKCTELDRTDVETRLGYVGVTTTIPK